MANELLLPIPYLLNYALDRRLGLDAFVLLWAMPTEWTASCGCHYFAILVHL
jgi:hypothetical protein